MVEVKITEKIKVGGDNPCFIIAEVGQNHQGDIEIAKKLIKAAKVSIVWNIWHSLLYEWFEVVSALLWVASRKQNNGWRITVNAVQVYFPIPKQHILPH